MGVYGGARPAPQRKALQDAPDVVVCTPGRLLALLDDRSVSVADVSTLVLDEADTLLSESEGFLPQVRRIATAARGAAATQARAVQFIFAGATTKKGTTKAAAALAGGEVLMGGDASGNRPPPALTQHFVQVRGGATGNKHAVLMDSIKQYYMAMRPGIMKAIESGEPLSLASGNAPRQQSVASTGQLKALLQAAGSLRSPRDRMPGQEAVSAAVAPSVSAASGRAPAHPAAAPSVWSTTLATTPDGAAAQEAPRDGDSPPAARSHVRGLDAELPVSRSMVRAAAASVEALHRASSGEAASAPVLDLVGVNTDALLQADWERAVPVLQSLSLALPRTIVFVNTAASARATGRALDEHGIPNVALHKDMPFKVRQKEFAAFQAGLTPVLVCTDAGARGLDLPLVGHVVSADFPDSPVEFLHRVGRTARAGAVGVATSLVTRKDLPLAKAIHASSSVGLPLGDLSSSRQHYLQQLAPQRDSVQQAGGKERPKATRRRMLPSKRRALAKANAEQPASERLSAGKGFTGPMRDALRQAGVLEHPLGPGSSQLELDAAPLPESLEGGAGLQRALESASGALSERLRVLTQDSRNSR